MKNILIEQIIGRLGVRVSRNKKNPKYEKSPDHSSP
jgi:hypothetical protein